MGARLHGGRHEKVLLLQAQLLALGGGVVGVEDGDDGVGLAARLDGVDVVAAVEGVQVEVVRGERVPEAQVAAVVSLPAGDGTVVRARLRSSCGSSVPRRVNVFLPAEHAVQRTTLP